MRGNETDAQGTLHELRGQLQIHKIPFLENSHAAMFLGASERVCDGPTNICI